MYKATSEKTCSGVGVGESQKNLFKQYLCENIYSLMSAGMLANSYVT